MSASSLLLVLSLFACKDGGDTTGTPLETDTGSVELQDADGDGFTAEDDCDDNNAGIYPGAVEICDGNDNNCNDQIDEDVTTTYYQDSDNDGFGDDAVSTEACEKPPGYVPVGGDCDDGEAAANPGMTEVCDYIDNNCDGSVDEGTTATYYADADLDGFGDPTVSLDECRQPKGYVTNKLDCDDTNAYAWPGNAEVCDEADNDCDSSVDEGVTTTYYADFDSDSYGDDALTAEACSLPTGYAEVGGDCDDSEPLANPAETEVCDTIDNNCDGTVDEDSAADAATWYADSDSDAYGDASVTTTSCSQPSGYVADATDCDDTDGTEYPGADEYCDGDDDDCDGDIDEDDAIDAATWYYDADSDGYGDSTNTDLSCSQPSGYVADSTDCDDLDATSYPGGTEVCDSADNDCNGTVDDNPTDGDTYYADTDSDGFGDPASTVIACSVPSGYSDNTYDCDDADSLEPMVVDTATGSSSGDGSSSAPFDAIQDGIDSATECVVVYGGTYYEAIDFGGRDLAVTGVEGSGRTTIDASGLGEPVVTFDSGETAAAELSGFTLTGGEGYYYYYEESRSCSSVTTCTDKYYTYWGGGIYVENSDPTLYDLEITRNDLEDYDFVDGQSVSATGDSYTFSYGGGIALVGSNSAMYNLSIDNNDAVEGGGVYIDSTSTVSLDTSFVIDNTALDGAGIEIDGGSLSETNVVNADNEATEDGGGVLVLSGTLSTQNVTYADNDAGTYGAAIYYNGSSSGTLASSIVYVDSTANAVQADATASFAGSYTNVYNVSGGSYGGLSDPTGTSGNISSDPLFVDAAGDDWTLDTGSPSIDAGDPSSSDADGSVPDQGAFGGPSSDWND
ncbi:MAG: putative metal-binding motif-containing protein [Myxococcota bacterium]|nr:putative metal-binding motif-containing protein [Myxococcota bacterium]